MSTLKHKLVEKLNTLPDISIKKYKETELLCVYFNNKEIAHFQTGTDCELDIRLTPAIIKREKLAPPPNSKSHPTRSKNSRWILVEFKVHDDIDRLTRLVQLASELT